MDMINTRELYLSSLATSYTAWVALVHLSMLHLHSSLTQRPSPTTCQCSPNRRYFGTLCGSTILQAYLLQWGVAKNVAFWGTIATGSLVNFIVLTSLAARSKSASSEKEHPDKTKRWSRRRGWYAKLLQRNWFYANELVLSILSTSIHFDTGNRLHRCPQPTGHTSFVPNLVAIKDKLWTQRLFQIDTAEG